MIANKIEGILKITDASFLAEIVCAVILVVFVLAVIFSMRAKQAHFVTYTPALLTTLGIFGTFAGIVIGLMLFDVNNIDGSITGLLGGLKTAFVTSLFGILASIIFKVLQSSGLINPKQSADQTATATPEDILAAISNQNKSLDTLVVAIGGDGDGSLVSQVKLLRGDVNDNQKLLLKSSNLAEEHLAKIEVHMTEQQQNFNLFSDKLWIKMQDFADMLSKSATETVIEALKQVITDFNNNLTEQFGENFKQLNESVKELVVWQENYKVQISDMVEQYKLGVESISATEKSVAAISSESQAIPKTMNDLKEVMTVNQHQLSELGSHLEAFKDMRDKAIEAVPEINAQIQNTVDKITESSVLANKHYAALLTDSDTYIKKHTETSNELLVKFANATQEGIDTIGTKLAESADKVEKVIVDGADNFETSVKLTNEKLKETAHGVSDNTSKIREQLDDTVSDLNSHVRDMIQTIVDNSKELASTLSSANKDLAKDTSSVRDVVVENIETMQKRLEASLEDVFSSQTQHMSKVFSNIDAGLKDQVGKTGEAVEKQLSMIDQSMQQELNRVMSEMGKALGQISNQFVNDYSKLVSQMNTVVQKVA
jgi:hypothetical protein